MRMVRSLATAFFFLFISTVAVHAQIKILKGVVLDKQSDEPIPFASALFKVSGKGVLTDSLGKFSFVLRDWPAGDTLEISSVGYKILSIPFTAIKDTVFLSIYIEVLPPQYEAVVKVKYNRALWFWKKIISNKEKNDKHRFENYGYEVYNKLEVDLNNIRKEKLAHNALLKPLNFILDYTDTTSEKVPFLPVYLTETLSDFYYQRQPYRTREVIKATITNGIENESLIKQLGATYQNVNVYENTIPVFDKSFISPLSNNADNFYNFKLLDTQYLNNKRLVHLKFTPKHIGGNLFDGDCWVNDTSYAIQKITLRPAIDANINFVSGLTVIQEFKLINDSTWFLYKDKFVADISPIGKSRLGMKGRKTATYKNVMVNSSYITQELDKSKPSEDVLVLPKAQSLPDSFWVRNRHEPLNKDEQTVYIILDTLEKNPAYLRYRNTINFLASGTKDIGNFRIGPWYYWVSGNAWEGTRMRFDLATNKGFSNHLYLHGYLAYGFKDQQFKGKAEMKYLFKKQPWSYLLLSYKNDLDNGQVYYDQLGSDNLFALFFRKPNVPYKYQRVNEKKFEYFSETNKSISFGVSLSSKQYNPLLNLPGKELFPAPGGESLNNFETGLRIRYAYQERLIEDNFNRSSFGSVYPIVELRYARGWKGVFNSSYVYHKVDLTVSDYVKLPPFGSIYYNFFAGKISGALPYPLLDILPGNDWYYYSKYSFNLMTRFEYLSDRYAGFNIEHNVGTGLFKYIPFTRKWKFRQFWEAKGIIGDLSDANKQLNQVGANSFKSLNGKLYMEVGTGVDNIFKLFRIDFIWRVLPRPLPSALQEKFGVFFGFRVSL